MKGRYRTRVIRYVRRTALVVAVLACALIGTGLGYYETLPTVSNAEARVKEILRAHHAPEGTLPIPGRLSDAVIAVEDEHFYSNVFVNVFDGVGRAALAALHRSGDPGGSTIAQQLAKQLYGEGTSFGSTVKEIALGVKLELTYSKPQILEMYLNAIYFGHGFWGYVAAAHGYFGVGPKELTWPEASMIAGLPEAPSAYDPLEHLALGKERQRHVLNQLVVNHFLGATQANAAFRARLPLRH